MEDYEEKNRIISRDSLNSYNCSIRTSTAIKMILKGKEHNVLGCMDFTSVQWKAPMRDVCQELVYTVVWPLCDVWTLLETLMLCMVLCSKVCFMVMYSLVRVMYGHYRRHFHLPIDVSPNIHWRSA